MTTVTERRGITYSAKAAGDRGTLRCHVIAQQLVRDGSVAYSIFVSNETNVSAQAVAVVPDAPDQHQRTIVHTTIGPSSDFSTTVVVELLASGSIPEIHVALTSAEIHFTLAVPGSPGTTQHAVPAGSTFPPAQRPGTALRSHLPVVFDSYRSAQRGPLAESRTAIAHVRSIREGRAPASPSVTPIVLCFVVIVACVAFITCRPQIVGFTVPQSAAGGTTIAVAYRATGLAVASYTMAGPDGHVLATGSTPLGSGTFSFALPRSSMAQAYLVRLRVSNPIGSAIAEDYVRVPAPPAPPTLPAPRPRRAANPVIPPEIRSLALDRATLGSGDTLNVYYEVSATSGTVVLVDPASQITYGKTQLDASGHATFVAPHTDTARFLNVIVTAERGSAKTQSRIGVSLAPSDSANPPTNNGAAAIGGADTSADGEVSPTEISAPLTVHSLTPIRVDIRGATAGLRLLFLDSNGNEVARRDVPTGQNSAEFTAPAVRRTTHFRFEATYSRGAGSETIVRAITVIP